MTQEQKKAELAQYLVTKGILVEADVNNEIIKMANALAPATATEKGLTTDIDKAYETMLIEKGAAAPAPTATAPVATEPTSTVSAAEQLAIQKKLLEQRDDRVAVSANSSVESYIFDRPDPAQWIPAGTKGVIQQKVWENIEQKYAGKVLDDDDDVKSKTNFEILKQAAQAGTPVDVYIGKLNTKPIGYVLNKGKSTGSDNTKTSVTREQAMQFLTLDAAGYILSSGTKPGLKLRFIKAKNDPRHPGQVIPAKTVLADANKKEAVAAGSYEISREVTNETQEAGVKSALAFKIDTGKPKANGQGNIIRLVRVTLKATIPTLARKPEFVDVFGTGEKVSNSNLEFVPEGQAAKNITQAQLNAIATLRGKLNNPETFSDVQNIADQLKAFEPVAGGPAPTATL